MFLFTKNNAVPRSRQSSVDSLVTDPSMATSSLSETYMSHGSDASSYGELPSPDHCEALHPVKRVSVFNLRSRSNTATSTASSFVSLSSTMARSESPSHRSSDDFRHLAGHGFLDLPGARRALFSRGKRAKRLSSQLSTGEVEVIEEGEEGNKRTSILRKGRRNTRQPEDSVHSLKHRISSPFDFQHLTHTDRHQFAALERASENDLAAEFWAAARSSQPPCRDLNGIKADRLHFSNFSSENLASTESRSPSALTSRSPPLSPEPGRERATGDSPERALRMSRSVESFSLPGFNSLMHRHTQSSVAPPRTSSCTPVAPFVRHLPEEASASTRVPRPTRSPSNRQSGIWDQYAPRELPKQPSLPSIADEPSSVGHAVTTPDNTAIHPTTPPLFSPSLEDVVEESDRFVSPRPAPAPPTKSPKSPRSPFFDSFSFRAHQRSPITRSSSRGSSYASPKSTHPRNSMTRPISQMSDTLGSPSLARKPSVRKPTTMHRTSNTWRAIEDSWEDDIDYIYDNALEADCDFDWDRLSDGASFDARDQRAKQQEPERPCTSLSHATETPSFVSQEDLAAQGTFFSGAFRPSLLVPSSNREPELESQSALSASTVDTTEARTPSDLFTTTVGPRNEHGQNALAPSLMVAPDFKEHLSREEIYDEILAGYEVSDRHYPLLDASTQSTTGSIRSSHFRSSKRSSYDSSLMSSGQASGSWSSPIRRSASSSGSLPELVHSRRARRDFNSVVDQLSEQVASLSAFGEDDEDREDNDITPPGRRLQTFFASDEEDRSQDVHSSIEAEVRASLELARQGSTRATRAPLLHKYASSDGVAKLLSSTKEEAPESPEMKPRHRAASSSKLVRGNRQPYLSLFPAPSKHAQLSMPSSPMKL